MTVCPGERVLFVTGRLAEGVVRRAVNDAAGRIGMTADVAVLPITVAALMHCGWVARKLTIEAPVQRVVLPGWCQGDLTRLEEQFGVPFERGPKDVLDLPEYVGLGERPPVDLSSYDIEILAEINHAPRLTEVELVAAAARYGAAGADVIDVGCIPGEPWREVGAAVRRLRGEGHRVSIDSFDRDEVEAAVAAGAELVLSCNRGNVGWAADLDVEWVAIPDDPHDIATLDETVAMLASRGRRFRIDPVIEPIGFGFAASLARYYEARRRWPDAPLMMGVGNITEMVEVDSAGINMLLAAICQELGIHSVLTTEVIPWARTSVREFDLARRLARHAVEQRALPKHVGSGLVLLRDARINELGEEALESLAAQLRDPNYRIFVERGEIHVMNRDGYWRGTDPFALFDEFAQTGLPLDPAHAFYLGYELAKAVTALTLGKQYSQDQALHWGFLTRPEVSPHERRHRTN